MAAVVSKVGLSMFKLGLADWGVVVSVLVAVALSCRWEWSAKYKRAIEERDSLKAQLTGTTTQLNAAQEQIEYLKRSSTNVSPQQSLSTREKAALIEVEEDELTYLHSAVNDNWRVRQWPPQRNLLNKNRLVEKGLIRRGPSTMYVSPLGREVYELHKNKLS